MCKILIFPQSAIGSLTQWGIFFGTVFNFDEKEMRFVDPQGKESQRWFRLLPYFMLWLASKI